jgi:hypothetical protein
MGKVVRPRIPSITIITDMTVDSTGLSMNVRNILFMLMPGEKAPGKVALKLF